MLVTWRSTARSLRNNLAAMARLVLPSAISSSTSRSRAVRVSSGPSSRRRLSIWADDLGVEHRAAGGDALDRLG
jgi:hypothetical protein